MKEHISGPPAIADIRSELLARVEVAPLDPSVVSAFTEHAVRQLLSEGEASNTLRSYRSALRYWASWFALRYHAALALPVPGAVVLQFIVGHAERSTPVGLKTDLPAVIDQALVDRGFKAGARTQHGVAPDQRALEGASTAGAVQLDSGAGGARTTGQDAPGLRQTRRCCPEEAGFDQGAAGSAIGHLQWVVAGATRPRLVLFAWASGGRRRSEVTAATITNLVRLLNGDYVYTMGHSKTNQDGGGHAANAKPVGGRAAQVLDAWLIASKIKEGAVFRRIRRGRVLGDALTPAAVRRPRHYQGALRECRVGGRFFSALDPQWICDRSRPE